jgi:hypothetical protein
MLGGRNPSAELIAMDGEKDKVFSPSDLERIISRLSEFGIKSQCPACMVGTMLLNDGFFVTGVASGLEDALRLGGRKTVYPCFALACQRCGHTLFFNANMIGLGDLFTGGRK